MLHLFIIFPEFTKLLFHFEKTQIKAEDLEDNKQLSKATLHPSGTIPPTITLHLDDFCAQKVHFFNQEVHLISRQGLRNTLSSLPHKNMPNYNNHTE